MLNKVKKLFKIIANFKDIMDHPEFFEFIATVENENTIDVKIRRKSEPTTKET